MMAPEILLGQDDNVDISDIEYFEPIVSKEFPTSDHVTPRIPRVLHQTWKDVNIPSQFQNNIRSFIDNNPEFEYFFWTDQSARKLIQEKYPYLLETFDNYVEPVRKADLLRYVVLYEFGGIYADLDTECVRPLDRVLYKYACVIPPEPYEHASLIYNTEFLVTNSIMACRPKHPFLKQVMDALPEFSHFSQDIDASGPNFLTYQYRLYNKGLKGNHFANIQKRSSKRKIRRTSEGKGGQNVDEPEEFLLMDELGDNFVYVPSSQYFQNDLDPVRFSQFKRMCLNFENLNSIGKRGCVSLRNRGMARRKSSFEFTKHSFYHTGYKWIPSSDVTIFDIVNKVTIYN